METDLTKVSGKTPVRADSLYNAKQMENDSDLPVKLKCRFPAKLLSGRQSKFQPFPSGKNKFR